MPLLSNAERPGMQTQWRQARYRPMRLEVGTACHLRHGGLRHTRRPTRFLVERARAATRRRRGLFHRLNEAIHHRERAAPATQHLAGRHCREAATAVRERRDRVGAAGRCPRHATSAPTFPRQAPHALILPRLPAELASAPCCRDPLRRPARRPIDGRSCRGGQAHLQCERPSPTR